MLQIHRLEQSFELIYFIQYEARQLERANTSISRPQKIKRKRSYLYVRVKAIEKVLKVYGNEIHTLARYTKQ